MSLFRGQFTVGPQTRLWVPSRRGAIAVSKTNLSLPGILTLAASIISMTGCVSEKKSLPIPEYPLPCKITILLEPHIQLGDGRRHRFDIEGPDIDKVYPLIKPTAPCNYDIRRTAELVARIKSEYSDGSLVQLFVRNTGDQPAAVSVDDVNYYWADGSPPGNGAIHLLRLLNPDNKLLSR